MTFLQYLDSVRIGKSIELLLSDTGKAIRDIGVVSGFMNESQFYKVFKKRVGETPGHFRELYAKKIK